MFIGYLDAWWWFQPYVVYIQSFAPSIYMANGYGALPLLVKGRL